jgi:hypothetical protein
VVQNPRRERKSTRINRFSTNVRGKPSQGDSPVDDTETCYSNPEPFFGFVREKNGKMQHFVSLYFAGGVLLFNVR